MRIEWSSEQHVQSAMCVAGWLYCSGVCCRVVGVLQGGVCTAGCVYCSGVYCRSWQLELLYSMVCLH
jgi:hypothetical protein